MVLFEAFITLLLVTNTAKTEQMAVLVSGQIVLGGLIPIHEKGESSPCGDKIYNRGVQRLEAMLFAIDMINADPDLLPGIIIGVHILDTCSRETYALNQTLQFIRASLNAIDSSILECGDHSLPRFKFNFTGPVFGVIGGSYSTVSLQVANLLGLFHIPQISPASTAKALSDKSRFEYFARTVPPDTFQSIALVDIVTSMGWSYVSTVYSEGSYGEHGIEVFHKEAQERDVCIAVSEKVPRTADDKQFDNIINKLRKKSNAKAVILFTRAEDARYEQDSKVQFVVDAVYAFAYALNNLYRDVCLKKKRFGVCPEMKQYDTGDFYKKYLLNVSFIDLAGNPVQFDERGDGLARYDILNFQKTDNGLGYHYKLVGKWFNKLELNHSEIIWKNNVSDIPISACSLPCGPGMIKKQQGDTCCWICDKCEDFEYVFDEFTCKDCGNGSWPYPDKKSCYPLEIQYLNWSSPFALIPLAFSVLGIIATLSVICLFIKHNDTPLVRASGRELSYMLLVGILLCYMNTFVLLAKPTTGICIGQRFGIGVSFSIIYGALLTKTNRISRIFDSASRSAKRPKYISPRSQVCITSGLIAIQIILTLVWMALEYPGTKFYYPSRKQIILKCKIQDMSFLFSQLYNMLLITICTVYAVKTRKIPENFNESKFIGFTMYTTCVIWLAFVPIYFGTGNSYEIQITTLCIAISMNATVALVCLYSPKLYIILFHPDKNVRKLTMNTATYKRSHSTPGSSHTPSSAANKDKEGTESIKMKRLDIETPQKMASSSEHHSESAALL
ncbi:metabotropic glutamate receptor isoform X3 [Agrilus planipennis]|uniref:Metabotropic glutamate receptor isoform X3 n=1 Tax=Agrilus planipennis TaxID=224129 RepID=A0A1W4WQC2_AGRPL|nr:metabotropic glutamate receptor isoform X3 [Agrilus planipennis]